MVGRLAVGQALAGLGTLHVVEPELGAHLHTVLTGDGATFVGALDDAQALVRKGLPLRLGFTAGQAHDNRLCSTLLSGLTPRTMVLAD